MPDALRIQNVWLDDAGGTVGRPTVDSLKTVPACQPGDIAVSVVPEQSSYASGLLVTFHVEARFQGVQPCRFRVACFPDLAVWDANGRHVWQLSGEVPGGGACGGGTTALLSSPTQHLKVEEWWRQDACWPFCQVNPRSPDPAAAAGQYTVGAWWPPLGWSPKSAPFQLQ